MKWLFQSCVSLITIFYKPALLIFIRKILDKAIMWLQTLFSAKLLSHRQTHIRKIKYNFNVHLWLMDHVTYLWSKQNNPKITTYPELSCTSSNRTNKSDHITPVLWYLQWLPAVFRIQLKILRLVYNVRLAPQYISDMRSVYNPIRSLRSQGGNLLHMSRAFSKSGDITFSIYGSKE